MSPVIAAVDGDLDDLIDPLLEESNDESITDLDDLIYQQESEVLPLATPPETEADFE
jgi:hypothetical protein